MKRVTRERHEIDRNTCPRLGERIVATAPEFLFVPSQDVPGMSQKTGAIAHDVPGVEFSHADEHCSFDAFLAKYRLTARAHATHAVIVHGADTSRLGLATGAAGLFANSSGLLKMSRDGHGMLKHGMVIDDAPCV